MRPQSIKQQTVSYTQLEKQGLVGMIERSDDLLKLLQERGFISIEGKFTSIFSFFSKNLKYVRLNIS